MATAGKNLSDFDSGNTPSAKGLKFGLVVSEWNADITGKLLEGAYNTLVELGASEADITITPVPGSFELPVGAKMLINSNSYDALVAIGSVIQGETKHFDFVCQATAQGVKDVSLETGVPVVFCVLTDNTLQQAIDRSGGKHGNKGVEAAVAAVKMAALKKKLSA